MLGSLASSLVATSALIAPFLLACACVVASLPCVVCSCGFGTNLPMSFVAEHAWSVGVAAGGFILGLCVDKPTLVLCSCQCQVLATPPTFWASLWFAFAVVSISAHVLFWQSRRLIRMGCERKSGGALALRRYVAEAEMRDKAAIFRESRKAREELSAKRGESTGRGRGALGRGGRGTSTGSADDG